MEYTDSTSQLSVDCRGNCQLYTAGYLQRDICPENVYQEHNMMQPGGYHFPLSSLSIRMQLVYH
jgi:hypothetical protein